MSLALRIVLLTILPIIFVGGGNILLSLRSGGLLDSTLEQIDLETRNRDALTLATKELSLQLNQIRTGFAAVSGVHQRSVLLNKSSLVAETLGKREELQKFFDGLQDATQRLSAVYEVQAVGDVVELQQKRLKFLAVRAKKLPAAFKQFVKANDKTIKHIEAGEFDQAAKRLLREENARSKVGNTLDIMGQTLLEFSEEASAASAAHSELFNQSVERDMASLMHTNIALQVGAVVGLSIFSLVFAIFQISRPFTAIIAVMTRISDGELDVDIPGGRRDEIGQIANALQVFKNNQLDNERLREQREIDKQKAETDKFEARDRLATEFDSCVGKIIDEVSGSVKQLTSAATTMKSIAGKNSQSAEKATQTSTSARSNIQSVASATEELSASISEINRQVQESANACREAVSDSHKSTVEIRDLVETADRIGEVIGLINDIADQTNLLALNATIEAARAGEAGKGFAVVASEVKNLAGQTAKATEEITDHIRKIQTKTKGVESAIEAINSSISDINDVSSSIAAAVEQQGLATAEIASSIEMASQCALEAADNMVIVKGSSDENGRAANDVDASAQSLEHQSETLKLEVAAFLKQVRTG